MAWLSDTQQPFTITTGDGRQYTPLWRNPAQVQEYQVAEFEFPNVRGTLVVRGQPKGRTFPIELYFQGDEHLTEAEAFRISAADRRPWRVQHPYYGTLSVHPSSLAFDNSGYNVTKVTGNLLETISTIYPTTTPAPKEQVTLDVATVQGNLADAYGNNARPTAADVQQLQQQVAVSNANGSLLADAASAQSYFNAFNTANGAITQATQKPLQAMRSIQAVIAAPALFQASVKSRIALLRGNLNSLIANLTGLTLNQKHNIQAQGGTLISAMALSAVNPLAGNYANKTDVLGTIDDILSAYNAYLAALDALQSINGGSPASFVLDATALSGLASLINFTLANLLDIAAGALQQQSFILEDDSNWVLLTHRLYGTLGDGFDANLARLISENNAGINEMLRVLKGRVIVYFV